MSNKVYVLCPPKHKTGGTELSHQLVYMINKHGGNAEIAYFRQNKDDNDYINPAFNEYVSSYAIADELYDMQDITVVIPEPKSEEVGKFKYATIYLWWMSVDFYYNGWNFKLRTAEYGFIKGTAEILAKGISSIFKRKPRYLPFSKMERVKLHLVQSEYAYYFLKDKGITNIEYLSDYINDEYVKRSSECVLEDKENIIIYNPKKGLRFTKMIILANKDLNFVPLINMTNNQVEDFMKRAKVYIDFGPHPGKDRMPREAVLMFCCVLTGKRGSAAYDDVLIPDEYKIQDKKKNIRRISSQIRYLLANYSTEVERYRDYRERTVNEKKAFEKEVIKIFDLN